MQTQNGRAYNWQHAAAGLLADRGADSAEVGGAGDDGGC